MERPILYPQSQPTEVNWTVQLHHSPPGSHHPKHVSHSSKMAIYIVLHVIFSLSGGLFFPLCATETLCIAFCLSGCGGVLTDSEGSFSSPNHPGSYPPNLLCVWVIRVPPPSMVQIHVSSLTVEGPSPCLFDWLEVQEQIEQSSVVTRLV